MGMVGRRLSQLGSSKVAAALAAGYCVELVLYFTLRLLEPAVGGISYRIFRATHMLSIAAERILDPKMAKNWYLVLAVQGLIWSAILYMLLHLVEFWNGTSRSDDRDERGGTEPHSI